MLTQKHLKDICLLHSSGSKRCRYLAQDDLDSSRWYCMKLTSKKSDIDDEVEEFLKDFKQAGADPRQQSIPLGDNCSGYILLKYLEQGYDKQ